MFVAVSFERLNIFFCADLNGCFIAVRSGGRIRYTLSAGGMASGVQVAISMSNTGGAWDNAKKYIERATPDSDLQGKGSDIHKVSIAFCSRWWML